MEVLTNSVITEFLLQLGAGAAFIVVMVLLGIKAFKVIRGKMPADVQEIKEDIASIKEILHDMAHDKNDN